VDILAGAAIVDAFAMERSGFKRTMPQGRVVRISL
jgi:hypothetical protein